MACSDGTCTNQGTCDVSNGTCVCDSGFLGDACQPDLTTDYCSDFNCFESGVITSPGFSGDYAHNLDLTWLIQVQIGQRIEINFLSFDLEEADLWSGW